MISCITYENLHQYGGAFRSQFQLRHRCFIERQKYNVSSYNGMEYDQYDTPAAVYLVYAGHGGHVLGCSRLTPVSQGSMLQDIWPDMVSNPQNIFREGVWEGTRFCIDKSLPAHLRQRICQEIVLSYLEFGLQTGMEKIIGIMPPRILNTVFGSAGCRYQSIGPRKLIDSCTIQAASMQVSQEQLAFARVVTGITGSVFRKQQDHQRVAA